MITKKCYGLGILNADSKTQGLCGGQFSQKFDNFTFHTLFSKSGTFLSISDHFKTYFTECQVSQSKIGCKGGVEAINIATRANSCFQNRKKYLFNQCLFISKHSLTIFKSV